MSPKINNQKLFYTGTLGQLKANAKSKIVERNILRDDIPFLRSHPLLSVLALIGFDYIDMDLKVDSREHPDMISKAKKAGYEVVQLKEGDYSSKNCGIERKSTDFLDSVFSRRIFKQLVEIQDTNPFSFLVVDKNVRGLIEDARRRGISENIVWGAIASLCVRGFPPIMCGNQWYAQKLIRKIQEKAFDQKDRILEYTPIRLMRKPSSQDYKLHILANFPGIGEERAKKLLEAFNWDLQEVLEYSWWHSCIGKDDKKWMKLSGLDAAVEKIREVLE